MWGEENVQRVLLMGESANEKRLLDCVWWALGELGVQSVYGELQVDGFDPRTVVSRGRRR